MKEKWEKPELVVLYRGNPEEDVLKLCKYVTLTAAGPQFNVLNCARPNCSGDCVLQTNS